MSINEGFRIWRHISFDPTQKMNFSIALFVSLFCGLVWAQEESVTEDSGASRSCLVSWDLQREFAAMKDKQAEMEAKLNKGKRNLLI